MCLKLICVQNFSDLVQEHFHIRDLMEGVKNVRFKGNWSYLENVNRYGQGYYKSLIRQFR